MVLKKTPPPASLVPLPGKSQGGDKTIKRRRAKPRRPACPEGRPSMYVRKDEAAPTGEGRGGQGLRRAEASLDVHSPVGPCDEEELQEN